MGKIKQILSSLENDSIQIHPFYDDKIALNLLFRWKRYKLIWVNFTVESDHFVS